MNDERDELLREIGESLSVEPKVGFEAQVRAEIERRSNARARWPWIGPLTAVAAAAVVVLAVVTVRESDAPIADAGQRPASGASISTVPRSEPVIVAAASRESKPQAVLRASSRRLRTASARRLEIIIPPGEMGRFQRLLADLRDDRIGLRPESLDMNDDFVVQVLQGPPPVEIPAILIAPNPFSDLDPLTDGIGG